MGVIRFTRIGFPHPYFIAHFVGTFEIVRGFLLSSHFELTSLAGMPTVGILKDVVMVGGYEETTVDFADDPSLTLFHCHQQLHMDFGFMTLFDCM